MIELVDAIDLVRWQLATAAQRAVTESKKGVVLSVENVEVSLGVEIAEQTDKKGGLNVWVFTIGGGKAESVSTTHTVKLTLKPHDEAGRPLKVSAEGGVAPRPPGT
ncbi:MAG: hypothetical protein M3198_00505 [Actinomycetota bacterium]|nr:hypothetical protein [Actinomycetota bacterium]